jgi:UDP-N-acetylmuramoyl-L-alanyl-D-glutamate--2,6-diaminopimelate ligase
MGEIAEAFADRLIITDENPRNEEGGDIVQHILSGMNKPEQAVIERDREKAIAYAIANAESGDVVVVAGKGHETYQDVGGSRLIFSDASQVRLALQAREKK